MIHLMYIRSMPSPFGRVAAPPPHFPVGGPVPSSDLVGRETYIRRIAERLEDGQHVLLAGPRRIGKTSLILEVLRRLRRRGADRKSTRLNSSHLVISYAVFCLKKK